MATSLSAGIYIPPGMQLCDNNGDTLNGGHVYVYQAGTTSNDSSYPTQADALDGSNTNANPVVLDANGRAQIWLQSERSYKIVVKDSTDATTYQTVDNYSPGQGNPGSFLSEWVRFQSATPTYVSGTQFTLSGDYSSTFHASRRFKASVTAGTVYGTVYSVSYSLGTTTINVVCDSGSLDSGLSAVWYGLLSGPSSSNPSFRDKFSFVKAYRASSAQTINTGAYRKIQFNAEEVDLLNEFDSTTNYRFTPLYQGSASNTGIVYHMMAQVTLVSSIVSASIAIYRDGAAICTKTQNMGIAGGTIFIDWYEYQQSSTGHYYEIFVSPSGNVDVDYDADTTFFHIRRVQ